MIAGELCGWTMRIHSWMVRRSRHTVEPFSEECHNPLIFQAIRYIAIAAIGIFGFVMYIQYADEFKTSTTRFFEDFDLREKNRKTERRIVHYVNDSRWNDFASTNKRCSVIRLTESIRKIQPTFGTKIRKFRNLAFNVRVRCGAEPYWHKHKYTSA